jgi:hypothetical protein
MMLGTVSALAQQLLKEENSSVAMLLNPRGNRSPSGNFSGWLFDTE